MKLTTDRYEQCVSSLGSLLEIVFKEQFGIRSADDDPLYILKGSFALNLSQFGDKAADKVVGCRNTVSGHRHGRQFVDSVIELGTYLSMRSLESESLDKLQKASPIMSLSAESDHVIDQRTHRMVMLCACWIALYFLGMRFDYMLAAVKRLAQRSQGYPNGFVSLILLAECIEDFRFDITQQSATDSVYIVSAREPGLYMPWKDQEVYRKANFSWQEVTSRHSRNWKGLLEYVGWFYYYWQCLLLGNAFAHADGQPRIQVLYLLGSVPSAEYNPAQRLHVFFGEKNVNVVQLQDSDGYPVGVYHARGGFNISSREGFGASHAIVARRLEGAILKAQLDALQDLVLKRSST